MKKVILSLLAISPILAFAANTIASAPAPLADHGIANGLYKSVQNSTFIKVGNSTESGLSFLVVASRNLEKESGTAQHGVSFDERLYFKKISTVSYVSTDQEKHSDCTATITKTAQDSFIIKVNSIDSCFNKHSQFNAEAPDKDQSKSVAPFLDKNFKLDTGPKDMQHFSSF